MFFIFWHFHFHHYFLYCLFTQFCFLSKKVSVFLRNHGLFVFVRKSSSKLIESPFVRSACPNQYLPQNKQFFNHHESSSYHSLFQKTVQSLYHVDVKQTENFYSPNDFIHCLFVQNVRKSNSMRSIQRLHQKAIYCFQVVCLSFGWF